MATIPPDDTCEYPTEGPTDGEPSCVRHQTVDDAPEELCLLHDTHARDILTALANGPRSGRTLADSCDISRPTAYRRLNRLEAAGFVTSELSPDPDGHHRKQFSLIRDRLTVLIQDGSITVMTRATEQ